VKASFSALAVAAAVGVVGCATQADLMRQDRQLRGMIQDNGRQVREMQKELERLRAQIEERGVRRGGGEAGGGDALAALDQRVTALEREIDRLTATGGEPVHPSAPAAGNAPPATTPPTTLPAAPAAEDDEWRRDVAREQAAAGAVNVPERSEYLGQLDALARKDCARAVPALNSFASGHKDSVLADNALYWVARCYALKGDQNQAISKFYDVVTRYPKGDKAPAALWAQGSLFIAIGDTPDARLALSKLIRDYPSSEETARARQKLNELEH
jgi:tol-pal system protein YbgF